MASISELPPVPLDSPSPVRRFRLTRGDVSVELSSLGASITRVLLPDYSQSSSSSGDPPEAKQDDVVLSYTSPREQHEDGNKPFFGAIVGRVANRVKDGVFQLSQTKPSPDGAVQVVETYRLEKNNGPNHLHGGSDGFWNRNWDAQVVDDAVSFALTSPDGDQGYPAGILVTAAYSLVSINDEGKAGVKLRLEMRASLLPGETKATPIALAQHSYFNLASHASSRGILDHTLRLPNCARYTSLDNMSVPTREVRRVDAEGESSMDFREEKVLAEAMVQYGVEKAGLEPGEAKSNVQRVLNADAAASGESVARTPGKGGAPGANLDGGAPYGFDHNYVLESSSTDDSLRVVGVLSHPPTGRSLRVSTSAPGVQLYTANYLDGTSPPPEMCKDGAQYGQWQGACLETQTYPDSIYPDDEVEARGGEEEFAKGRCFVLRPGGEEYFHAVEYEFGCATSKSEGLGCF